MPRISTFYGIVIAVYFDDHPPPHFHARYGEFETQVALHREELQANWDRARAGQPLVSIETLP